MVTEPLLIDSYVPEFDHAVVYSRVFRAPPDACFEAVTHLDLLQRPVLRLLLRLRGLPQGVADALKGTIGDAWKDSLPPTVRIVDLPAMGWVKLSERADRELAYGYIGRPWKAIDDPPLLTAEGFTAFDEPGFAKLVESTRVDAYGERCSIVTLETRVVLTDEDSRRRFRRYWLLFGPVIELVRPMAMRELERQLHRAPAKPVAV